jgi:hypothetical protein
MERRCRPNVHFIFGRDVRAGNVPAGYRETVPLDKPDQGDEVVIYLDTRGGGSSGLGFGWGALAPGTLLTDDGPKSRSQWLDYAIKGCGGP